MKHRVQAGKYRHRVTIKRPSASLGARGQRTGEDETVATEVPAAITALGGEELVQARQVFARARYRVELRFNPTLDLTEQHYLEFRSRRLNIGMVTNVNEENVEWTLLCAEDK